uniref:Uncharacterized protein n=1 Tax=Heliothis virescens TaxID=7102 RepID=A0A2A4J7H4_HELVI
MWRKVSALAVALPPSSAAWPERVDQASVLRRAACRALRSPRTRTRSGRAARAYARSASDTRRASLPRSAARPYLPCGPRGSDTSVLMCVPGAHDAVRHASPCDKWRWPTVEVDADAPTGRVHTAQRSVVCIESARQPTGGKLQRDAYRGSRAQLVGARTVRVARRNSELSKRGGGGGACRPARSVEKRRLQRTRRRSRTSPRRRLRLGAAPPRPLRLRSAPSTLHGVIIRADHARWVVTIGGSSGNQQNLVTSSINRVFTDGWEVGCVSGKAFVVVRAARRLARRRRRAGGLGVARTATRARRSSLVTELVLALAPGCPTQRPEWRYSRSGTCTGTGGGYHTPPPPPAPAAPERTLQHKTVVTALERERGRQKGRERRGEEERERARKEERRTQQKEEGERKDEGREVGGEGERKRRERGEKRVGDGDGRRRKRGGMGRRNREEEIKEGGKEEREEERRGAVGKGRELRKEERGEKREEEREEGITEGRRKREQMKEGE